MYDSHMILSLGTSNDLQRLKERRTFQNLEDNHKRNCCFYEELEVNYT